MFEIEMKQTATTVQIQVEINLLHHMEQKRRHQSETQTESQTSSPFVERKKAREGGVLSDPEVRWGQDLTKDKEQLLVLMHGGPIDFRIIQTLQKRLKSEPSKDMKVTTCHDFPFWFNSFRF